MMLDRLFVYGSLRRGRHPMAGWLARRSRVLGPARVRGRLYRVADYPGLVPDPSGPEVAGELLWLRRPAAVLRELDRYEGCRPGQARPHEFVRRQTRVWTPTGEPVTAWIYLYNRPVAGLSPIPGDGSSGKPVCYPDSHRRRLRR